MLTVSLLYSMVLDTMVLEGEMLQMSLHNSILDYFKDSEEPILSSFSRSLGVSSSLLRQVLLVKPDCKIVILTLSWGVH